MRILQIAPPWFKVPPESYGGIESVVAELTDGLVDRGHEVTLLASGGSGTTGRLWTVLDTPPSRWIGSPFFNLMHCVPAYSHRHEFDVIHDHSGIIGAAIASMVDGPPVVHTLHGPWDPPEVAGCYATLPPGLHLVSISHDQAARAPDGLHHAGVVHNGIAVDHYPLRRAARGTDGYLCFVGRATPDKGPDTAIRVARQLGRHLEMLVKINEPKERAYWRECCEPLLAGADVEVRQNLSTGAKAELLAGADATLFPIRWNEPFGLVMVESMACGTPVVAYRRGAASEVIVDGQTGYLVEPEDLDAFAAAVDRVGSISPEACRAHVERSFSSRSMVDGYAHIYDGLVADDADDRLRRTAMVSVAGGAGTA
jgi:glycosyltransferase involved in cell wall biosynthesis